MANYSVNVGNVYEKLVRNGNLVNKSKVTITSVNGDDVVGMTASKKEIKADVSDVKMWKLLHYEKKATKVSNKRLNQKTAAEVAIETILSKQKPLTAKELVDFMKTEGTYKFSEKAKTPVNSISTRLNEYINETKNPKIKKLEGERGKFVPFDFETKA